MPDIKPKIKIDEFIACLKKLDLFKNPDAEEFREAVQELEKNKHRILDTHDKELKEFTNKMFDRFPIIRFDTNLGDLWDVVKPGNEKNNVDSPAKDIPRKLGSGK